jgi:hypothetical protein
MIDTEGGGSVAQLGDDAPTDSDPASASWIIGQRPAPEIGQAGGAADADTSTDTNGLGSIGCSRRLEACLPR